MRIFNEPALKADIDNMFDVSLAHQDKAIRDWFKAAWLKPLLKNEFFQKHFLHKISALDGSSKFQGFAPSTVKSLVVRPGGRKIDIKEFNPDYDVKDAKAGILYWYQPTTHSLIHYKNLSEVTLVRDYFEWLLDQDPNTNLRKMNAQDAVRAAEKWHADEARRAEAERLKREEEEKLPALKDWRTLREGSDYTYVCDFVAGGETYTMIRLTSPKALVVESAHMAHCTYTYKDKIYNGVCVILSIRKKKDVYLPLVTAELSVESGNIEIVQIRPYHNGWSHNGIAAVIPPGVEDAAERVVKDPQNLPRFKPLHKPGEFRVDKGTQR